MSSTLLDPSAPTTPAPPLSAEAANEAIRRYVADRRSWSRAELAELDRLRALWRAASRKGS